VHHGLLFKLIHDVLNVSILMYITFSYSNWYITSWKYQFWCISRSPIQIGTSCLKCINYHVSRFLVLKLIHHVLHVSILMHLTFSFANWYITIQMYQFWCISRSPIRMDTSRLKCINFDVSHVPLFKLIHHKLNVSILMELMFSYSNWYITSGAIYYYIMW